MISQRSIGRGWPVAGRYGLLWGAILVVLPPPARGFDSSQVLFYAPFDGRLEATVARGQSQPRPGASPTFVEGVRGQAVRLGRSAWGQMSELPVVRMPVDVGLWRPYGLQESAGPLRYPAAGNILEQEGTLSFWYRPLGWHLANSRDHFMVNLGMKDTLAIGYFTYFGLLSFQNSIGESPYKRCIGYLPEDCTNAKAKDRWMHLALGWRDDFMKVWCDGRPVVEVKEGVIPLRNATGELMFGSGDVQEAAFDEVLILAQAATDTQAQALYRRAVRSEGAAAFLAVPPIAAPTIDGKATSAEEWQGALGLAGWADSILGVANADRTRVRVGCDARHLYVCFLYPIPPTFQAERTKYVGSPLKVTVKDKDADLSPDDFVGVHLATPDRQQVIYLAVNGASVRLDEKNGDRTWDGAWQVGQAWTDDLWTVEFAIPLELFGAAKPDAKTFGINFRHGSRQMETLDSVWYYAPAEVTPLAALTLGPAGLVLDVEQVGELSQGMLALKGRVRNTGREALDGRVQVRVSEEGEVSRLLLQQDRPVKGLAPGTAQEVAFPLEIDRPVFGTLRVTADDARGEPRLVYTLPFVFSRQLSFEARLIPTPQILQAVIDLGSTATVQKAGSAELTIVPAEGGQTLVARKIDRFQQVRTFVDLDVQGLPVGRYEAAVRLQVGGTTVTLQDRFEKPPPPAWLGSKAGLSDRVPPPWTPVAVADRQATCWGRRYTFGPGGLPVQVRVQDQDILAAPARIVVKRAGVEQPLAEEGFSSREVRPTHFTFQTRAVAGSLRLESDTTMEFDGFVWTTLRLTPQQPTAVEALAIEFPLKKEHATLWWPCEYVPSGPGGLAPSKPTAGDPMSGLRIGDEERGLQFFFEDTSAWRFARGQGQELRPGPHDYVIRYNVIGTPTTVQEPMVIGLGYMALPCRPRSPHFRRIDGDATWTAIPNQTPPEARKAALEKTGKLFGVSPIYTEGWSRHWNYLNFWNTSLFEKEFIERVRTGVRHNWEKARNTLCLYLNVCTTDANTPEYRQYRFEWRPVPGDAPYIPEDPKTRDKAVPTTICVASPAYVDFYMSCLEKTLRYLSDDGQIPIHGYLDNSGYVGCANTFHGCPAQGWAPIRAHRQYMKRLYTLYKSLNPLNQVFIHCSGWNLMSAWSFSDWMIEGEQMTAYYMSQLANDPTLPKNYTKLITLEKARSQFQPYAFGPDRLYLYQFWGWNKTEPHEAEPCRAHLWGLMLSVDSGVWAAGTPANIVTAIHELGWDEQVEFIPYWRPASGIRLTGDCPRAVASAWRRGPGNLLVMVFNDADKPISADLTVDFDALGFPAGPIQCRDYGGGGLAYPESFKAQPVKDAPVQRGRPTAVTVGEHSYRLLRFFQAPQP